MRDATIKNKGMLKYIASEFRVVVRIEGSWRKADNLLKKVISFNYLQVTTGTCGLTCRQYPYPLCVTWAGTVTVMALFLPKPAGFNPGIIWMTRATLTYYFSHIWIITIGTSIFLFRHGKSDYRLWEDPRKHNKMPDPKTVQQTQSQHAFAKPKFIQIPD